jgi:hypothetical protein
VWDMTPRKIAVGVLTADCLPALHVAASEAALRRCGVHLLHVVRPVFARPAEDGPARADRR